MQLSLSLHSPRLLTNEVLEPRRERRSAGAANARNAAAGRRNIAALFLLLFLLFGRGVSPLHFACFFFFVFFSKECGPDLVLAFSPSLTLPFVFSLSPFNSLSFRLDPLPSMVEVSLALSFATP